MITMRNDLNADELYFDSETEQYFYTPNPPGVIWLSGYEVDQMFGSYPANIIDQLESV
jgi:hypothetical protein